MKPHPQVTTYLLTYLRPDFILNGEPIKTVELYTVDHESQLIGMLANRANESDRQLLSVVVVTAKN